VQGRRGKSMWLSLTCERCAFAVFSCVLIQHVIESSPRGDRAIGNRRVVISGLQEAGYLFCSTPPLLVPLCVMEG
jgi:hypothetical protein